jgi:hypothetical protein
MHTIVRTLTTAGLLVASSAAFGQSINTNYAPGTDFSKYHSYRWVQVQGATTQVDQILDQEIKQSIDKQLTAKSLAKKDADPADLYVAYQVAVQQEQELNAYGAPGWRFGGMANVTTTTIDVGTLTIDVYDPAQKQLLWRGSATESVSKGTSPEKKQAQLDKAMAKLLKNFPPSPKK